MINNFKPTYLYIKQHSVTGLLYFGKTTQADKFLSEKYKGSGHYWTRHITKHGIEFVNTIWYCLFIDKAELENFALIYSAMWDIVKSTDANGKKIWANEKIENGLDGGIFEPIWLGKKQTEEHKRKRLDKMLGSHRPADVKKKVSDTRIKKHAAGTLVTNAGLKWTDEQKAGLSKIAKERPLVTCLCCKKCCNITNFNRWHGDKCKPRSRSTLKEQV